MVGWIDARTIGTIFTENYGLYDRGKLIAGSPSHHHRHHIIIIVAARRWTKDEFSWRIEGGGVG